jgi:hypothetical protein
MLVWQVRQEGLLIVDVLCFGVISSVGVGWTVSDGLTCESWAAD